MGTTGDITGDVSTYINSNTKTTSQLIDMKIQIEEMIYFVCNNFF